MKITMKKTLSMIIALLLAAGCLSGCGSENEKPATAAATEKIKIVTTIFPEYDWVMNILGENASNADVDMLLDNGVDIHSFQPTVADILNISTCDLFIYVGGESDDWVDDALLESTNKDMTVIDLLDVLGDAVKEEELVEGMQEEEHEGEDQEHDEDSGSEEPEYDEHVWLSLKNAEVLVNSISSAIQKIDPEHADLYRANTAKYTEKLNALDAEYRSAVHAASIDTLLFGDRFPFRYMTDDYGLNYYAAFAGCSAETEASFKTITFLSQKLDELSLPAILTIEGTDHRIAETIVQNTQTKDQNILVLDSMQSVRSKDVNSGASYLSAMEKNLSVLKEALGLTGPAASDNYYFACIIQDATACCAQGIEFELKGDHKYPDDYPETGTDICVTGVFDTYEEGGYNYCTLKDAVMI